MTNSTTLSLKENFGHMMARLDAGSLSEEDAREFRKRISLQIEAADRLALDTPPANSYLFLNARMVMGFAIGGETILSKTVSKPPNVVELVRSI